MGNAGEDDGPVSERRALVRRLEAHGDVVAVDFTRDGYRWVFVETESEEGLSEGLRHEARRLGYDVEALGADTRRRWRLAEWWPGAHEAVHLLRLGGDREPSP